MRAKLFHQVRSVGLHGLDGQRQKVGDLSIGLAPQQ